jgi:hypothetical protein
MYKYHTVHEKMQITEPFPDIPALDRHDSSVMVDTNLAASEMCQRPGRDNLTRAARPATAVLPRAYNGHFGELET